jgi:RecG-like helicase
VYRQDVKHADFKRIMPKIIAHLKKVAVPPPHAEGVEHPRGDFLPSHVLQTYGLLPWLDTLDTIHAQLGTNLDVAAREAARRRLVFNEMLLLSIMMLQHRAGMQGADMARGNAPVVCSDLVPYHL